MHFIDSVVEMRALVRAQLDAVTDANACYKRAFAMWQSTHRQLEDNRTLSPAMTRVLQAKADMLYDILLGVDVLQHADNDPESLIQSALDGRGYPVAIK